jgi:PKD repeat protein
MNAFHKLIFLLVVITLSLCSSCKKKELPESTTNEPVFSFDGSINGIGVNLIAGVNNYHMYSSYLQDSNDIYSFIGTLKRVDCTTPTCKNSIQIQLIDDQASVVNGPSNANNSIQTGTYSFGSSTSVTTGYKAQFNSSFTSGTASTYTWTFGDGGFSNLANPSHTYATQGKYNVCLTVASTGSCSSSVCNVYPITTSSTACKSTISVLTTSFNTITFTTSTSGTPPYNYFWNFGDGGTSTSMSPSHTYSVAGQYNVNLKVTDAASDSVFVNYKVNTQTFFQCATNQTLVSVSTVTGSTTGLPNVIVKWTDSNGIVYTSDNPAQPSSSYFQVLSVENYHDNESGEKTKKIHVQFKCMVYNGASSLSIDPASAVIVVAYK